MKMMILFRKSTIMFLVFLFSISGCNGKEEADDRGKHAVQEDVGDSPWGEIDIEGRNVISLKRIVEKSSDETEVVTLSFANESGQNGPRMMELYLQLSDNLQYVSSERGQSLVGAEKELVVQTKDGKKLRIVAYSSGNVNELQSGVVARLSFRKTDENAARLEILTDSPIFAPSEANEGLLVGDPIFFE